MSECLVATVAVDINAAADEAISQLSELDESMAEVVRNFDAKELMTDCVEKVLAMYRENSQYKVEDGFLMTEKGPHWQTHDPAGNQILGVVKSKEMPRGIGFVVSPSGRVGFVEHHYGRGTQNDPEAQLSFKNEAKDLLLTHALSTIFKAAGFEISEFQMEQNEKTGELEAVKMMGVRQ
jgi:hypothetical protein